jgi:hypothetical protein
MARVRLDHLTREELKELIRYGKDAHDRLVRALFVVIDARDSLDEVREIVGNPKFLGGGSLREDKAIKMLDDLVKRLEEVIEEIRMLYLFGRK